MSDCGVSGCIVLLADDPIVFRGLLRIRHNRRRSRIVNQEVKPKDLDETKADASCSCDGQSFLFRQGVWRPSLGQHSFGKSFVCIRMYNTHSSTSRGSSTTYSAKFSSKYSIFQRIVQYIHLTVRVMNLKICLLLVYTSLHASSSPNCPDNVD